MRAIVIIFILLIIVSCAPQVIHQNEIKMYLKVGDHIGINADSDALWFGTAQKGRSANLRRDFRIANEFNTTQQVILTKGGTIAEYVNVSSMEFTLKPGEKKDLKAIIENAGSLDYGNYTGTLTATFYEVNE